jgi:hypothetical protein
MKDMMLWKMVGNANFVEAGDVFERMDFEEAYFDLKVVLCEVREIKFLT